MRSRDIEKIFPNLASEGFAITSPITSEYNCIAWAAGDTEKWWWPTDDTDLAYWPDNVPRQETLESFIQASGTLSYQVCENAELEAGFEKVAIYANDKGIPTHAARQLSSGLWTSKLGSIEGIEHKTLEGIINNDYGHPIAILKRKRRKR